MTQYPLYRRLGRPRGRSGRVWKMSPPPGFDPRTVQPVASGYTVWSIPTVSVRNINLYNCMSFFHWSLFYVKFMHRCNRVEHNSKWCSWLACTVHNCTSAQCSVNGNTLCMGHWHLTGHCRGWSWPRESPRESTFGCRGISLVHLQHSV